MDRKIPYGQHYIDNDDIKAVVDVLKNHPLTQGKFIDTFEKKVAAFVGAKYAVAMSSWTAGLHMACLAAGVKKGDKVVTSPITFVASANAALYCSATPIFVDIDSKTANIDPQSLEDLLESSGDAKAIIPVHYAGLACDMKEIRDTAKKNDLIVIEDAAHALGAKYQDGSMIGNCKYSDMTGFSFHPVKSIATGEGGMITTNNQDIYRKLLRLRSHGINKTGDEFKRAGYAYTDELVNPWYYEMQELGFNYRITDIQCALGISQLKKLHNFIERRIELVRIYDEALADLENIKPAQTDGREISSHHLYPVRIDFQNISISRAELMLELQKEKILTQVHYVPVPMHPYYEDLGHNINDFPNAKNYYNETLSLPLYYALSNEEQERVIDIIKRLLLR
tara:strand:+ start:15814 stop:16998 length:1185 start_codon:yes stop_codon:yes gene_type:complete